MKKHRILLPVILIMLVTFLPVEPAAAQSTKTDFTATATLITTLDPGELWLDGADNLHVRGEVQLFELDSPDPQVDGTFTIEIDLVLRKDDNGFYCSGPAHGSLSIDPEAVDGTWEVTWSGMFTDCGLTGHANGHGTGNLAGQTIKFTAQEINPPGVEEVYLIGNIHNPHGN